MHALLNLAEQHFQHWQKARGDRTERYRELQAAEQAQDESAMQLRHKLTEAEVEATVNVRMLQHCIQAAEDIANRLPIASPGNPQGENLC